MVQPFKLEDEIGRLHPLFLVRKWGKLWVLRFKAHPIEA